MAATDVCLEQFDPVATKIKLQRHGKMREPHYRIVVADARTKRDGRAIEAIGQYHPKNHPSIITIDGERAAHWLSVGAQPTDAVLVLLKITGDWQKFKGLPAPPPMLMAEPKVDKREAFQVAARAAAGVEETPATTPKKAKKTEKAADAPSDAPAESATPAGQ
jgi:small subunit ribosomal protein S16